MGWAGVLGLTALLAACAPSLDWREVRVGAADSVALFPCKAASHARLINLAGQQIKLTLHACQAGDATWGLAWADVGDPARVGPALQGLQAGARMNLGQAQAQAGILAVKGRPPPPEAGSGGPGGQYPGGQPAGGQGAGFTRAPGGSTTRAAVRVRPPHSGTGA